jgi:hypothetical protein
MPTVPTPTVPVTCELANTSPPLPADCVAELNARYDADDQRMTDAEIDVLWIAEQERRDAVVAVRPTLKQEIAAIQAQTAKIVAVRREIEAMTRAAG